MNLSLKEMRQNAGLSAEQVAEKLGVSRSYYSHMENGRRKIDINFIEKLSKLFKVNQQTVLEAAVDLTKKDFLEKSWIFQMKLERNQNEHKLIDGFIPYLKEYRRDPAPDDIFHLLKEYILSNLEGSMKIEFKKYPEIENYLSEQIHR